MRAAGQLATPDGREIAANAVEPAGPSASRLAAGMAPILEQPAPEDAAAQLIFDATLHALDQAGDGTRFLDHRDLAGLKPWKVDRVYLQLLPGSTGKIALDPFEVLPCWQANVRLAAAKPQALLHADAGTIARWNYRAIDQHGQPLPQTKGTEFFAGLSLPPGGDVRRQLSPFDDRQLDQVIKAAQRQRNFISYADSLDDPAHRRTDDRSTA